MPATGTFTPTLRCRPDWSPAIPLLLQKEHRDWKEYSQTPDLSIPLSPTTSLHILLLSPAGITPATLPQTMRRIDRLCLEAAHRSAILFLLSDPNDTTTFGELQIHLLTASLPIPLLPLPDLTLLPAMVERYVAGLLTPHLKAGEVGVRDVLPYTGLDPPLPGRVVDGLMAMGGGLGSVVDVVARGGGVGRMDGGGRGTCMEGDELEMYLGEDGGRRVRGFWGGSDESATYMD